MDEETGSNQRFAPGAQSAPFYTNHWFWYILAGLVIIGLYLYEKKKSTNANGLNGYLAQGGYTPAQLAEEINYMTTTLNGMQQTMANLQGNSNVTAASAANNAGVNNSAYGTSNPSSSQVATAMPVSQYLQLQSQGVLQ